MKKCIFILFSLLFGILSAQSYSQYKPFSGESFLISYDPAVNGILKDSKSITLVYTFDYWGTLPSAPNSAPDLFKNVETPDAGKANRQEMTKDGNLWKTAISIPKDASLLSYYFTDGTKQDYNGKKTYVSYVYGADNKPVRNARFSNADFLVMAGKTLDDQVKELAAEVKNYPDNFTAHFAYWNKKMDNIKEYNALVKAGREIDGYYKKLEQQFRGNYDVLNAKARTYDTYRYYLGRVYSEEYTRVDKIYKDIIYSIPPEKMSASVRRSYEYFKKKEEAEKFNATLVGSAAPDFEFETIEGQKHKLSDFKGKTVLLDFWGTWCGPCVGEIPNLKKAYSDFKDRGFEIISISSDAMNGKKDKEYLKKFTEEKGMAWTHVLDDEKVHGIYKITHWPTLYLIDKDGRVIRNEDHLRGESLGKTLQEVLQ